MPEQSDHSFPLVASIAESERFAVWVLGMAVALGVFFQVHVSLPSGVINVNLADPLAVLALAGVGLPLFFTRQLPSWKSARLNIGLGLISVLLLLGFVHGWSEVGVTQWALGGRLLGWVVLLGYLSTGYLIVARFGNHGLRRFAETLFATAVVVVVLQVILRVLDGWGWNVGARLAQNFEGYAGNRNAFAFQLLVVLAVLLGYSEVYVRYSIGLQRRGRVWVCPLLMGIILAGVVWTGSRAGLLVGVMVLCLAGGARLANRGLLVRSVLFAILLWSGVWGGSIVGRVGGMGGVDGVGNFVQSTFSDENSNHERWQTLVGGFELWKRSPLFGAGLGVFHAKSSEWLGHPQVIHSTPVWILAELGLLGAAVLGWIFFLLVRCGMLSRRSRPANNILLLLLFAFLLFGLAHEIFYQRIFWLVLGAVLAQPFVTSRHTYELARQDPVCRH